MNKINNYMQILVFLLILTVVLSGSGCLTNQEHNQKMAQLQNAERQQCNARIESVTAQFEKQLELAEEKSRARTREETKSSFWEGVIYGSIGSVIGLIIILTLIGSGVWAAVVSKSIRDSFD